MTLKELLILGLILFFALFTRLFRLDYPDSMYFDEVYHVPAAILIQKGDLVTPFTVPEANDQEQNTVDWLHPPLAKYCQALSMTVFGVNALAWRLPSLVFSLFSLVLFYFCLRFLGQNFLFKTQKPVKKMRLATNFALVGVFLFSLDGLFLVQSRLAMNDVFVLFFVLAAVFVYLLYSAKKNPIFLTFSGLLFGLALASKWSALWLLLLIFLKELLVLKTVKKLPFLLFSLVLTPLFFYCLSYLPIFFHGQSFADFVALQKTILSSQLTNPNTHLYSSSPLSWLFNLRPVWYFAARTKDAWTANIYALDNPLLSVYLVTSVFLVFAFYLKKKVHHLVQKTVHLFFLLYLCSFLPWLIFSRPMFIYHYLLAVPFLLVLTAYFLVIFTEKIKDQNKKRALIFNLLFWPFFFFIVFYPHWIALPVPEKFAQDIYFFLPSWQ